MRGKRNDFESVEGLANIFEVTQSTVYRWIRSGNLSAQKENGKLILVHDDKSDAFITQKIGEKYKRPRKAWTPQELHDYSEWHLVVDYFCWLLKVCYSTKEEIQRKAFRLDVLFANYLRTNRVTLERTRRVFLTNPRPNRNVIINDLKRGWYNELAYSFPLKEATLSLQFGAITTNLGSSAQRFLFPSWRITTAYYAFYFYLRGLSVMKQPSFRLQEHGATISAFKNHLSSPLEKVIWKFPFNISYTPGVRVYRRDLMVSRIPHLSYQYSLHPRSPNLSPVAVFEHIHKVFRRRSRSKSKLMSYSLFDFFHDFRVWANYLDIDNLLSLWGSGYKAFLDQNLSTISFFVGGIAELCFISVFGQDAYLAQLQNLYDVFAANAPGVEEVFTKTPVFYRMQIYNILGLVEGTIAFPERVDFNAIHIF